MVIKWGRFGRFLACSDYPNCKSTRPLKGDGEKEGSTDKLPEITNEICEKCGAPLQIKIGRYGKFLACTKYTECKFTKPIGLGVSCPQEGCKGVIVERKIGRASC